MIYYCANASRPVPQNCLGYSQVAAAKQKEKVREANEEDTFTCSIRKADVL
jgi:hypothetical protein